MKKLLALLLTLAMVLALVACGGSNGGGSSNDMAAVEAENARAEIRNAISLLFDRNYIVEEIGQGGQVPASSFVAMGMTNPDGTEFYKTAGNNEGYYGYYNVSKEALEANFNKAIEVLKKYYDYDEATGMFTNFPTMTYLYNTSEGHKAIGEYLQAQLASVGITMNLENQEWATFMNTRKNGDYSIARNGWVADYNDPICFLDMWTTASGNNDVQFGKGAHESVAAYSIDITDLGYDVKVENGTWAETYDVLIKTIKSCTDNEVRYKLMHRAEDLLMSTGCICPIYYYTDTYMISKDVDGFFANPLGYKYFMYCTVPTGSSISVCLASEPDTLDPALNSAVDGATLISHLFSGLAKWSQDASGKLVIVPDAAEELVEGVVNEDETVTYTYKLRDGLKWSDGKDVTAADFEFAWKRAASEELGADYGYMFEVVDGYGTENLNVKAVDEKTLEVTLANAVSYWNELLAFPTYFPVREDVVSNEGWATDPKTYVCNGAYTITKWDHNSVITLEKNANYVDAAAIKMDKIDFYLSDDANNMVANFKNGTWQLIDDVPTNEMAALKAEYPDEYIVAGKIGTYYVCWNINEDILPATAK
ncbi:MAG: hypothetical protein IJU94_04710 [Clostridia bacterium]|nr:hypothetical protein [Clostridia bacterium]